METEGVDQSDTLGVPLLKPRIVPATAGTFERLTFHLFFDDSMSYGRSNVLNTLPKPRIVLRTFER